MSKRQITLSVKPSQMLCHETSTWHGFYARNIDGCVQGLEV
jgi:hypothetical protein